MYEILSKFAQTWGLLLFIAAFLMVLIYALNPKNKSRFESARRIPLDEDSDGAASPNDKDA
jgi:cytochrome c oxidase cbb3-type subunit 4